MYLARITISFPYNYLNINDDIKRFNEFCSRLEVMLFHLLPKKTNFGNYGFFQTELRINEFLPSINKVQTSDGQIATCKLKENLFELDKFLELDIDSKLFFLLDRIKESCLLLSTERKVDVKSLLEAIETCRKEKESIQVLAVTKFHRSKKCRVQFQHRINLKSEDVKCYIIDRDENCLEETLLFENEPYNLEIVSLHKSKWTGSILNAFDQNGQLVSSTDVAKYL